MAASILCSWFFTMRFLTACHSFFAEVTVMGIRFTETLYTGKNRRYSLEMVMVVWLYV